MLRRELRTECQLNTSLFATTIYCNCNYNLCTYVCQLPDRLTSFIIDVICAKDFEVDIVYLCAHSFHSTSSVTRFFTPFHWSAQCNVRRSSSFLCVISKRFPPSTWRIPVFPWPPLTRNLSFTSFSRKLNFSFSAQSFFYV